MQETNMREKLVKIMDAYQELQTKMGDPAAVSYTHLTLPTILRV